jgi:glycine dehydrogenase subunit 2
MRSKRKIETYAEALRRTSTEAYDAPENVKTAPHNQSIDRVHEVRTDDLDKWAMTWRAYLGKFGTSGGKTDV